jgi:hypothetical protein
LVFVASRILGDFIGLESFFDFGKFKDIDEVFQIHFDD